MSDSLYSFSAIDIDGKDLALSTFSGKSLYSKHDGLAVLGFPCNQFAAEEPGSESQIKAFVTSKYGVTFPMFSKVEVNGPGAHPIYQFLKSSDAFGGGEISWNFQKFLVDREGHVVKTFLPKVEPEDLEDDIVSLLNK